MVAKSCVGGGRRIACGSSAGHFARRGWQSGHLAGRRLRRSARRFNSDATKHPRAHELKIAIAQTVLSEPRWFPVLDVALLIAEDGRHSFAIDQIEELLRRSEE